MTDDKNSTTDKIVGSSDVLGALPCPFCGSSDISDGEVLTKTPNGQTLTQSMCRKCGALGPEMKTSGPDYGDTVAIRGWNMRAHNAGIQPSERSKDRLE